jgi:hypothetical protein
LILTDVDNSVLGDPQPILDFQGDVSAGMEARMKWTFGTRNRIKANISSRIMVFRPTAAARKLAEMWLRECEENPRDYKRAGDELQLLVAFMN